MDLRDADVQLTAQRLRELMLWHGTDESNLPPPESLANLSRDTVAALVELQEARQQLAVLRASLSQLFWSCDTSEMRRAILLMLGAPPEASSTAQEPPLVIWEPVPNGLDWKGADMTAVAPHLSSGRY